MRPEFEILDKVDDEDEKIEKEKSWVFVLNNQGDNIVSALFAYCVRPQTRKVPVSPRLFILPPFSLYVTLLFLIGKLVLH